MGNPKTVRENANRNYTKKDVAAVVVTYNGKETSGVIDVLLDQTAHVVIVDNGSEKAYFDSIESYKKNPSVTIIKNAENMGQAEALNQGWKKVDELGLSLVMTMDQDSLLQTNCVSKLLKGINDGFDSVGPNYDNIIITGDYKKVRYLITSGNLMTMRALRSIGGFDSNLFIDSVDFDVSLRLRKAGYRLAIVNDARMEHYIGERNTDSKGNEIFEHSITRHYFIARNHYYILKKYFSFDPVFCIKKHISYIKSLSEVKKETDSEKKFYARKRGRKDARKLINHNDNMEFRK